MCLLLVLLVGACSSEDPQSAPTERTGSQSTGDTVAALPGTSEMPAVAPTTTVPVPTWVDENGFDDHTVPEFASIDEFFALARGGVVGDQSALKFAIPDLNGPNDVRWFDSNFYSLHDEWFSFRLLNGQSFPGAEAPLSPGLGLATVEDMYAWAEAQEERLPLGLTFIDSLGFGRRLYADPFYDLVLHATPKKLAVGSVIHFPGRDGADDRWVLELGFGEIVSPESIGTYLDQLIGSLPSDIGSNLEWVVRSPQQEAVAQEMETEQLRFHERIVRYNELVPPGEVSVYNEGIAAGRLLYIGPGGNAQLSDATENDILILENVPDWLPPASAVITQNPQTPLAHVNLLARNRGIPNASQSGLLDDANVRQAARVRARAVVRATADGGLDIELIERAEYDAWRALLTKDPIAVPDVDISGMPYVVDLVEEAAKDPDEADLAELRPVIGGKATGFVTLLGADDVTTPDRPMAITIRPYREHLATVQDALEEMLSDPTFSRFAAARFLLLEGPDDYQERYGQEPAGFSAAEFIESNPPGTLLGDVIESGGFKKYFRAQPLDSATLDRLTSALTERFGDYEPTQGLRFRSSSSVEDIEGFSGAGLYDSNTGFLAADTFDTDDDRERTVERALKKTWASYWGFEAFEERRLENVDHRSGAMGVLVHARFDDELEMNNGVATFTILPDDSADEVSATINAQVGAVSVTNPDPTMFESPEILRVIRSGSERRIERDQRSSLSPQTDVLTDDAAIALFDQLEATAQLWLQQQNSGLSAAQESQTLTLDFEFKTMAEGWPARTTGLLDEPRLVVKQARSLEPGLRGVPTELRDLAIPRDVLSRARLVQVVACPGSASPSYSVLTDPLVGPDLGYGDRPFVLGVDSGRDDCDRETLYSTPDQYLIELLASKN